MHEEGVILLAEDREDDIALIQRAFRAAYITNPLHVVRDGEEAIAYLKGEGKYARREEFPLPSLLLLDLKMPKVDGFEVLKWIRQETGLVTLRVVVLTSSEDLRDVNTAYRMGANSFMVKPMDFGDVVQLGQFVTKYWLGLSRTPDTSRQQRKIQKSNPTGQEPQNPDEPLRH